jgi:hypothetical protein
VPIALLQLVSSSVKSGAGPVFGVRRAQWRKDQ